VRDTLEVFARYTQTNGIYESQGICWLRNKSGGAGLALLKNLLDTLKRLIIDKGYIGAILQLAETGQTSEIRKFAAKIVDNVSQDGVCNVDCRIIIHSFLRVQ